MTPEQQKIEDDTVRALILETKLGTTPDRLSEIIVQLSGHFATLAEEFENLVVFEADAWLDGRATTKSDAMADRLFNATPEGKRIIRLKIQMKYIEKVISAGKARLQVKNNEAHHIY